MPILFSLITCRTKQLASFPPQAGNFGELGLKLVRNAFVAGYEEGEKISAPSNVPGLMLHMYIKSNLAVLAVADDSMSKTIVFGFCICAREAYSQMYGNKQALNVTESNELSEFLANQMSEAADKEESETRNPLTDGRGRLSDVQADIDAVQDSMRQNMGKVIERGTKMEVLEKKSDTLNSSAMAFQRSGANLRRHMWWQKRRMQIFSAIAAMLILVIYVAYKSSSSAAAGNSSNSTETANSTYNNSSLLIV